MSLFSAIDISGTGVDAMQTWIDTSAGNIANVNDETSTANGAYAAENVNFSPITSSATDTAGEGVHTAISLGSTAGVVVADPSNPLADANGEVRSPDISLSDQLVNMMTAQDNYQANTSAISRATAAYQAALTIGA